MKRLLLVFAITALFLPVAPQIKGAEVSIDFFYNNLNGGSWLEAEPYGYVWQPDVAVNDSSWRPYADGYWAYTDDGWTWVSYEDFGWATYHYGRWARLADYGWVWVPGNYLEWGPAWVSWRTGGSYIGWAPLPPEGEPVYEGRPINGHVDIEFDIGPAYYNFCDVRYIGEPVLRSRIVDVSQNVVYINQTVNVTNITYKNKTVYNYGPDINVVNQYSSRPIQRLKLERQANVDVNAAAKSGGLTKVQGNALVVAAPMRINKAERDVAPPTVKTKIAQPKLEKGWSVVGDTNAQSQLKEKIKMQDLKKVPPMTAGGGVLPAGGASVAPTDSASPNVAASPFEKGKRKTKLGEEAQPGATAGPAGALTSPTASPAFLEKGKGKGRGREQFQPGVTASPGAAAETSPGMAPESGKLRKGKRGEQFGGTPPTGAPTAAPEGVTAPEGKRKSERNLGTTPGGAGSPSENLNMPRGKHKQFEQPGGSPSGPQGAGMTGQGGEGRGKPKAEGLNAPPSGAAPTTAPATAGGEGKGNKKEGKNVSPTPGPR